jgi:hypothetical protein
VLPPTLATMTPQNFNAIRYDGNHSLWKELNGQLDVQFFHVGMGFKPAGAHVQRRSEDPQAREVHFRPSLFNYENTTVDTQQLTGDLGFSGFKLFKAPELDRTTWCRSRRQLLPRGGRHWPVRPFGPRPGDRYLREKAKNSLTSPSSGSRLRTRTPRALWSTPCSTRPAPPAPIASISTARPSAW